MRELSLSFLLFTWLNGTIINVPGEYPTIQSVIDASVDGDTILVADGRLIIYDLLGREVVELVTGRVVAGIHSVVWDANNLASGVYIYQLTTDHSTITKKLVLLK